MTDTPEDKELVETGAKKMASALGWVFDALPDERPNLKAMTQEDFRIAMRAVIPIIQKHYEQQRQTVESAHLRAEAAAMRGAPSGLHIGDTWHDANWADKPHRVLYDACALLEQAADTIDAIRQDERKRIARELVEAIGWIGVSQGDLGDQYLKPFFRDKYGIEVKP